MTIRPITSANCANSSASPNHNLAANSPPSDVRGSLLSPGTARAADAGRTFRRAATHVSASYYRPETVEGTTITQTSTGPGGSYASLEEAGHILTEFYQEFRARMPTPEEIRLLQLPLGTPVVCVLRVAYTAAGPIEVYESVVNANMIVFTERFPAPE